MSEAETNDQIPLPPVSFSFLVISLRAQVEMQLGLMHFGEEEEQSPPDLRLARPHARHHGHAARKDEGESHARRAAPARKFVDRASLPLRPDLGRASEGGAAGPDAGTRSRSLCSGRGRAWACPPSDARAMSARPAIRATIVCALPFWSATTATTSSSIPRPISAPRRCARAFCASTPCSSPTRMPTI